MDNVLHNVCPNCGGNFEKRPIRTKEKLQKDPPTNRTIYKPVNTEQFGQLLNRYKNIAPNER